MRRQESTQLDGRSAGRNEAEMRSEERQVHRQRFSHPKSLLRFAPQAVVALGGGGAAHRMHQNERPPLPGTRRSTYSFGMKKAFRVDRCEHANFYEEGRSNARL